MACEIFSGDFIKPSARHGACLPILGFHRAQSSFALYSLKMPVICLGPVCIPMNLLLPFLLGLAHHYGFLKWVKREWVTYKWWKERFFGPPPGKGGDTQRPGAAPVVTTSSTTMQRGHFEGTQDEPNEGHLCECRTLELTKRVPGPKGIPPSTEVQRGHLEGTQNGFSEGKLCDRST